MVDLSKLGSLDTETYRFQGGLMAPPIVCASAAIIGADGRIEGRLLDYGEDAERAFIDMAERGFTISFVNAPYDLGVLAQRNPALLPLIFKLLREGRIHDNLISHALDQIYRGTLFVDPKTGGDMRSPSTGKVTNRYSLELVHYQLTGKVDAKANDVFRKSYALLDQFDRRDWPETARTYPVDDACNTLEDTVLQVVGRPGTHEWVTQPAIPGVLAEKTVCRYCGGELTLSWPVGDAPCEKAPRLPNQNADNQAAQVEAAFAAHLGACHSFRTDPEKITICLEDAQKKEKKYVERFKAVGWIRKEDGSEDTAAIKRAVAIAYGATGTCKRCEGTGRVVSWKMVPCRGEKVRGRYQGCGGLSCGICGGSEEIRKDGNEITCKHVFDKDARERGVEPKNAIVEHGCDGTGLDLETAPFMPRTDTHGVKTNRDALTESGDDQLADYGDDTWRKTINNYVPYLIKGVDAPLLYSPNVLVATGRYSYEDSPLHQMPRKGLERVCLRARGAWCGCPIEYVLGSTDYEAGELCTLSVYCKWVVGHSQMMEAINKSGKPGILHSDLAAQVLGIPLDEFLARLKAKDKQAVDFRQASKPYMFGRPGMMGSAKIVLTNRGRNVGFTAVEGGPARDDEGNEGYWGIRFCVLLDGQRVCGAEKITQWKKRECAPVCKRCVEVVEGVLGQAYNKRYPEMPEYFNWVMKIMDANEGRIPSLVWDPEAQRPRVVRWRGGADKPAAANNGFQSMLADVIKDAYVTMTRECYLGHTDEGLPSPLYGCRVPLVIHDEPLSELIAETAHLSGPRIAEIMMASGRKIAPDVVWKAETALSVFWEKSMESVYDASGKLIPWEPKRKAA